MPAQQVVGVVSAAAEWLERCDGHAVRAKFSLESLTDHMLFKPQSE